MSGLRILLAPFAVLYAVGVAVRNLLFDIGVLPTTKVGIPVISVGNISAGGTGKTPLVEYLARFFKSRGKKVAIISRGYKRTTTGYVVVSNGAQRCAEAYESGDEPSQLADKLDGVVVVVDEKRVRAAQRVIAEFKPDIILLDDGFQHRYLHRDLNIAVVASDEVLSGSWLLPVGNRREMMSSLKRANVVVVSRCHDEQNLSSVGKRLARWNDKPVFGMKAVPKFLKHASTGDERELNSVAGRRVVAFSGIGNPKQFEQTLQSISVDVVRHHLFADHHQFTEHDLEAIQHSYSNERADMILTTEKDVARLRGSSPRADYFLQQNPVYIVGIEVDILGGRNSFESMLGKFSRGDD